MVWCFVYGVVWHGMVCSMVLREWCGVVLYGMVWYSMVWHGMICLYGVVWCSSKVYHNVGYSGH